MSSKRKTYHVIRLLYVKPKRICTKGHDGEDNSKMMKNERERYE